MRTRFKKLILAMMLAMILQAFAHDFEVDGIYYSILSSNTVKVSYEGENYDSYTNEYTGSVTIPETVTYSGTTYSVTSIGDYAFEGCSGLTEVTIPNSVTLIGLCAFKDCTGLTSITIPDSVTSIYNNAFSGCNGMVEVNITDLSAWCKIDFDVINANPLQYAHHLKLNGTDITNLVIPYGITEIKNQAFGLCTGLTSVTIPNSVISIGELAFALCSGLTEVTIGNSVSFIGDYAFKDCNGLTRITSHIPADKLFALDSSVLDATIKENCTLFVPFGTKDTYATTDGWSEFTNIEELEELNNCGESAYWSLNKETGVLTISGTGAMYDYESGGSPWYNNRLDIKSVEIANGITSIGNFVFQGCSNINELIIADGTENLTLDLDVFHNCPIEKLYLGRNLSYDADSYYGHTPFNSKTTLKEVTIGNSVTSINDFAFSGCRYLTSVTIGNSVTEIGSEAFSGCSGLKSVTIPNSVTEIGWGTFDRCSGLTEVNIADGTETLSIDNSFTYCPLEKLYLGRNTPYSPFGYITTLKEVIIGNSVTEIGSEAFSGCSGLTSVTIPNSVTSIGGGAFSGCSGLAELNIADGTETLSLGTLTNCPIEKLYLGRNLSYNFYRDSPFSNKTTLKELTIGNSVTSIGDFAFYKCSGLTSVTIPNSVTYIGEDAFEDCSGLTEVNITDLSAWCNIHFYYTGSNPLNCAHHLKLNGKEITDLIIPDGITEIKSFAFEGCRGLTSVTIPNSVTSIGWAFSGCTGLTSVTIGNSVTEIGYGAFWDCSSLKSIEIPTSVTSIGDYAFDGCSGLTSATIPNSVTSIGWGTFNRCSGLTEVNIADGTETLSIDGSFSDCPLEKLYLGRNLSYTYTGSSPFYNQKTLKEITIGNSVTEIGENAFEGCSSLKDVNILGGTEVLSLGSDIFYDCLLEKLYLGRNFSYNASNSPFSDKTTLKEVTIGNYVTEIGESAFYNCSNLTSIIMPDCITEIRNKAFLNTGWYNCQPDGVLYLDNYCIGYKGNSPIGDLSLKEGTRLISDYAFYNCSSLKSIEIPNSVTHIGQSAFYNCRYLTSVEYNAENLLKVGESTNLSYAKTIIVGEDVETIPAGIINSSAATTIISKNTIPPVCDSNAFSSVNKSKCTLYVSVTSLVDYWSADVWKEFANIKPFTEVSEISLGSENYTIKVGESLQLETTIAPSNASISDLIWTSSNPEVATVSSTGKVVGIKPGESTITVETVDGSNLAASCTITVETTLAESIKLSQTEVELAPYESVVLTYTILPANTTNKSVTWSSSDESIATFKVNNDGSATVLMLKDDKAVITVTTNDGSNLSASCIVGKTSGVDITTENELAVTVEDGKIVVKNVTGIVTVYNITGIAVATETANGNEVRFDNLQPGVYIVVVNNKSVKVVL